MPSNYKKICQDNIRRRGEEFDDIGRLISEQLYSDRSHFIYELLQNAEDALERRFKQYPDDNSRCGVQFRLFRNRLEFRHFGILFTEDDVKGISDILKGTKNEDFGQIGKFGIGFKSVYAFTASPEIHSGDEHFVIERYIRPEEKILKSDFEMEDGETVFIFPFDHAEFSEEQAFNLISNKLRELGPRVLLFLRRIDGIEWYVDSGDAEKGEYIKETRKIDTIANANRVIVIGQKSGQDEEENWLLFERPVNVSEQSREILVELGFRLEAGTKERIKKIEQSPLVVYFPTEKETRLGFLIQGPYETTSSRENINKDNDWNKKLIKETAELVTESLHHLKKIGLLSVSLLEALPIRAVDFPEENMFSPIYTRVRDALKDQELLPANDGTFVAAQNAKLVRGAELTQLLDPDQLRILFQSNNETKWLSTDITQDRSPNLRSYLMNELEVKEVDSEIFAHNLSEKFLASQNDEWFIKFYSYLSGHSVLWQPPHSRGILRKKPILRLQDGSHVNPFRDNGSPNAYIAIDGDMDTSLSIVKVELSQNENAHKFLADLGIPEVDLVAEVIENVLPKYTDDSVVVNSEENRLDLKKIEQAHKTDSREKKERLLNALRKTPFILTKNVNKGKTRYRKPDQVYFGTDELCLYFSGNASFAYVSQEDSLSALFKDLEVKKTVRIRRGERNHQDHIIIKNSYANNKRGLNGFDPDIHVDGLECAIDSPTLKKSAFIWNVIAVPNSDCIRGEVESSTRRTYEGSTKEEVISEFGRLLIDSLWLPDTDGKMYKPSDLSLDDLPEAFHPDKKLADKLGMKKDDIAKLLEKANVPQEDFDRAKQIAKAPPETREKIDSLLQGKSKRQPQFPEKSSVNPERRRKQLAKQYDDAPEKKYRKQEKSSRTTRGMVDPSDWLRNQYTNDSKQMVCQICKEKMPFRKRDGYCYFEAVEAFTIDYFPKEHEAQFLALCPLCAAMYQEFIKRDETAMKELHDTLKNSHVLEVQLKLGEQETSIRFVETHFHDITTILKL